MTDSERTRMAQDALGFNESDYSTNDPSAERAREEEYTEFEQIANDILCSRAEVAFERIARMAEELAALRASLTPPKQRGTGDLVSSIEKMAERCGAEFIPDPQKIATYEQRGDAGGEEDKHELDFLRRLRETGRLLSEKMGYSCGGELLVNAACERITDLRSRLAAAERAIAVAKNREELLTNLALQADERTQAAEQKLATLEDNWHLEHEIAELAARHRDEARQERDRAVEAERERCAKIAEDHGPRIAINEFQQGKQAAGKEIAAAIREQVK